MQSTPTCGTRIRQLSEGGISNPPSLFRRCKRRVGLMALSCVFSLTLECVRATSESDALQITPLHSCTILIISGRHGLGIQFWSANRKVNDVASHAGLFEVRLGIPSGPRAAYRSELPTVFQKEADLFDHCRFWFFPYVSIFLSLITVAASCLCSRRTTDSG